ncbi:MAG: hypothetical protein HWE27_15205 [Gammaproteobacteria bacterium]|nr:hypothetical protein [Gammaproteobacteria bacterium]
MAKKQMKIGDLNYMEGNKAVAQALLLYYHLAREGCFSGDETVYIDPETFDGFRYLDVVVEDNYNPEINEKFLREAAIIFILCDLNDEITEHDDSFHYAEITKKAIAKHKEGLMTAVSEIDVIFSLLDSDEANFDFSKYNEVLREIYDKYIFGFFKQLANAKQP